MARPARALPLLLAAALGAALAGADQVRANTADLMRLLEQRRCTGCQLADADLVHADLRDADLSGANLRRANLGQARLDGAQLGGADLSFTSLQGASLRGADLRGARLEGTDLRQSDLSGARLDPGALEVSHWQQARGLAPEVLSYPQLHNAGVEEALAGRQPQAEQLFSEAIRRQPEAAISWVARGITRSEQGNSQLAAQDFAYAASLYERGGETEQARQLREAARALQAPANKGKGGNGLGGALLSGAAGLASNLAPMALKFLAPALGL
ncbi:MAG: pentapeptide repeat-containing protein [Synechococcaceae cyanobacterium]|nr:pentapeptide repeat-containing protein [Synechococcaceae cyanobacterium]